MILSKLFNFLSRFANRPFQSLPSLDLSTHGENTGKGLDTVGRVECSGDVRYFTIILKRKLFCSIYDHTLPWFHGQDKRPSPQRGVGGGYYTKAVVLSGSRGVISPTPMCRESFGSTGDVFGCHNWQGATRFQWVEARAAAEPPTVRRMAQQKLQPEVFITPGMRNSGLRNRAAFMRITAAGNPARGRSTLISGIAVTADGFEHLQKGPIWVLHLSEQIPG